MTRRQLRGWCLSFTALAALAACNSSKNAALDAATGNAGAGGASGASGGAGGTTGGAGGATGGAGGNGMCDPKYANGYEADFDITLAPSVTPNRFCFFACTGVSTSFKDASGALLNLYYGAPNTCPMATRCDTCTLNTCPANCPQPTFPQTFRWNGTISLLNSCTACKTPGCGPAIACESPGCAPPGHYTAKFCVSRAAPDAGATCFPGTQSCTTVEFDLPSTAHIPVQLQP